MESAVGDVVDHIRTTWQVDASVECQPMQDLDSSNLGPSVWSLLAQEVASRYDAFDGFVVSHGTNTLAYTAAALSFALANSRKPIVITGAQVPLAAAGSDGAPNVANALRIACYPDQPFMGVVTVFGSHVIAGARTKKTTEFGIDAFESYAVESLARIGRTLDVNEDRLAKHSGYLTTADYNLARLAEELVVEPAFRLRDVVSLTEFPGIDVERLIAMIDGHDRPVSAFIIRAFGAGDASESLVPFFSELRVRGIPAVVTSQIPRGLANFQVNQPGNFLAERGLAIAAHDMSIEATTVKLGWLLARTPPLDHEDLARLMTTDMRGEISTAHEERW